jgi:heptaprenyl diphosphate synthase
MVDDLGRTEAELRRVVESDDPFLTEVARHLIDAGGKRVRPALVIAGAMVLARRAGTDTPDVL